MKDEMAEVARCEECGVIYSVEDMEECPDGELRCWGCLNYELYFTEEEM